MLAKYMYYTIIRVLYVDILCISILTVDGNRLMQTRKIKLNRIYNEHVLVNFSLFL